MTGQEIFDSKYLPAVRERFGDKFSNFEVGEDFKYGVHYVTYSCPVHGRVSITAHNLLLSEQGCKKCSRDARYGGRDKQATLTALKKRHGDKYQYKLPEVSVRGTNRGVPSTVEFKVRCKTCKHVWSTTWSKHYKDKTGCPRCAIDKQKSKWAKESERTLIAQWTDQHGGYYDYSKVVYRGGVRKVTIVCPVHGEFLQTPVHHSMGCQCPKCAAVDTISRPHKLLIDTLPACEVNARPLEDRRLELDMYWPDAKLGLEINGRRWHSDMFKDKHAHLHKTEIFQGYGVDLMHFWDDEIVGKLPIVKSMVLNRLGKSRRLYARDFAVDNVSTKEAGAFLERHHLQGSAPCSIAYGLRSSEGRLAMVATFARPRFSEQAEWELIRLASHKGVTVAGGASRLISHFRREQAGAILSYADRRYSQGKAYIAMGFTLMHATSPGYSWTNCGSVTLPRYKTQKAKLRKLLGESFDPQLSESENMRAAGYVKIYDCGQLVFKLS